MESTSKNIRLQIRLEQNKYRNKKLKELGIDITVEELELDEIQYRDEFVRYIDPCSGIHYAWSLHNDTWRV